MEIVELLSKAGNFLLLLVLFFVAAALIAAQFAVTLVAAVMFSGILNIPAVAGLFS